MPPTGEPLDTAALRARRAALAAHDGVTWGALVAHARGRWWAVRAELTAAVVVAERDVADQLAGAAARVEPDTRPPAPGVPAELHERMRALGHQLTLLERAVEHLVVVTGERVPVLLDDGGLARDHQCWWRQSAARQLVEQTDPGVLGRSGVAPVPAFPDPPFDAHPFEPAGAAAALVDVRRCAADVSTALVGLAAERASSLRKGRGAR